MGRQLYVLGSAENYTLSSHEIMYKIYHSFDTKYKLKRDEHFDSFDMF
jgi:hypothetical protein